MLASLADLPLADVLRSFEPFAAYRPHKLGLQHRNDYVTVALKLGLLTNASS